MQRDAAGGDAVESMLGSAAVLALTREVLRASRLSRALREFSRGDLKRLAFRIVEKRFSLQEAGAHLPEGVMPSGAGARVQPRLAQIWRRCYFLESKQWTVQEP